MPLPGAISPAETGEIRARGEARRSEADQSILQGLVRFGDVNIADKGCTASWCSKAIIPEDDLLDRRRLVGRIAFRLEEGTVDEPGIATGDVEQEAHQLLLAFVHDLHVAPPGNRGLTYKGRALGRTRTQRQANGLVGLFGRAARVDAHGRDPLPLEHLECGPGELVVQLEAALDAGRLVVLSLLEVAAATAPACHGVWSRVGETEAAGAL